MIGVSVEQSMLEHHRGVRERLGMAYTPKRVLSRPKPPQPVLAPPEPTSTPVQVWSLPTFSVAVAQDQFSAIQIDESVWAANQSWREIVRQVCVKHRVSTLEIRSRYRDRQIVRARHEAFYRLRTETTLSLPAIGIKMGGFDHSSVHNGIKKHAARLLEMEEIK